MLLSLHAGPEIKGCTVVRELASHLQCETDASSIPPLTLWVEFVVGSLPCSGFPLLKNQHLQLSIQLGLVDEEPLCGCATCLSTFTYLITRKARMNSSMLIPPAPSLSK